MKIDSIVSSGKRNVFASLSQSGSCNLYRLKSARITTLSLPLFHSLPLACSCSLSRKHATDLGRQSSRTFELGSPALAKGQPETRSSRDACPWDLLLPNVKTLVEMTDRLHLNLIYFLRN
ncbi:unnamed protein product [Protopolystoma xenopodis]|uniref:Uncharacterized protein n=1 Tax=Protopolystoma xenopodis TaxID=117903 RepID=A0A448XKX5_9PLAT|nr:unnamed protein product [Protopolystoma xenopodis]